MEPISQSDLHQDCLDKLSHALDLVLKTAETASAENNHKIVIQAAREVTRIATLITKMTAPKTKAFQGSPVAKPGRRTACCPPSSAADTGVEAGGYGATWPGISPCRTSKLFLRPARSLPGTPRPRTYLRILPEITRSCKPWAPKWPPF